MLHMLSALIVARCQCWQLGPCWRGVQHAGMRTCCIWIEGSSPAQGNSSQHCKLAGQRCTPVQAPAKRPRAAPPSTVTLVVLPEQATMALFRPVLVVAALVAFVPRPTMSKLQTALQGQPHQFWWQAWPLDSAHQQLQGLWLCMHCQDVPVAPAVHSGPYHTWRRQVELCTMQLAASLAHLPAGLSTGVLPAMTLACRGVMAVTGSCCSARALCRVTLKATGAGAAFWGTMRLPAAGAGAGARAEVATLAVAGTSFPLANAKPASRP